MRSGSDYAPRIARVAADRSVARRQRLAGAAGLHVCHAGSSAGIAITVTQAAREHVPRDASRWAVSGKARKGWVTSLAKALLCCLSAASGLAMAEPGSHAAPASG